jgi:ubiquitin-protein ligase
MGANKRIVKELNELSTTPPPGTTVKLASDDDMNLWVCYIGYNA